MTAPQDISILVIGAGTFGISTAYHLALRGYKKITCIDRQPYPSSYSAANDLNKIIRTDYDNALYTKLAVEALDAWRGAAFKDIYHETGRIATTCGDAAARASLEQACENLNAVGRGTSIEYIRSREDIIKHCPNLAHAKDIDNWKGIWNTEAGWAHSRKALEKWATSAARRGALFISGPMGTMTELEVDDYGSLRGIKTASGDVHIADRYIFCPGAAAPSLLPDILSEHLSPKCWAVAHLQLGHAEVRKWAGVPVIDNLEMGYTFEPDHETGLMKICDGSPGYELREGHHITDTGQPITYSVPHYASKHVQHGVPEEAIKNIRAFVDSVMPEFKDRPLIEARLCWDTDTVDSHYLIDKHPKYPEMLIATGGSAHAFKMFPIIGDYIVDAMEGKERGLKPEWRLYGRETKRDTMRPDVEIKDLRDMTTVQLPTYNGWHGR